MKRKNDAAELSSALFDFQKQLGALLNELGGLQRNATPNAELIRLVVHVESLLMEAEAVLYFPELLDAEAGQRILH